MTCAIEAYDAEIAREAARVAAEIEPRVRALLHAEDGAKRKPLLRIVAAAPDFPLGGDSCSEYIRVFDNRPEEARKAPWVDLPFILSHELVHWMVSYEQRGLETIPAPVEEGLALLIMYRVGRGTTFVPSPPVSHERLMQALTLSTRAFESTEGTVGREISTAGTWTASELGFDLLRALAIKAHEEGRKTIPPAWILANLPSFETRSACAEPPEVCGTDSP